MRRDRTTQQCKQMRAHAQGLLLETLTREVVQYVEPTDVHSVVTSH